MFVQQIEDEEGVKFVKNRSKQNKVTGNYIYLYFLALKKLSLEVKYLLCQHRVWSSALTVLKRIILADKLYLTYVDNHRHSC